MDNLFTPLELNKRITLKNRIIMAPLTRCMADDDLVPTQDMADYYARRAETGLIISEAIIIRPDGQGYPNTPGIFTSKQVEGWKIVTSAVHQAGVNAHFGQPLFRHLRRQLRGFDSCCTDTRRQWECLEGEAVGSRG